MIDTEKNNSIIDRKNMMIVYKAIRRYKPMIDRVAIIGTIYNIVLMLKKPTFIYNLYKLLCMRILYVIFCLYNKYLGKMQIGIIKKQSIMSLKGMI